MRPCSLLACVLALALLLPGAAPAATCALRLLADVPLRDTDDFLTIEVSLDGHPASLLLDTGSEAGLISPDAARALRLPRKTGQHAVLRTAGGGGLPMVTIARLTIGALTLLGVPMPVGDLPTIPAITPPVVGLIGGDLLGRLEVEIDAPGNRLRLFAGEGLATLCRDLPPWREGFDSIPLSPLGNRRTLAVTLDGHPITALVDTGARSRIVSTSAALALGVDPEILAADPGGEAGGVGMPDAVYHWHRFRALQIGGEVAANPVLTVTPFSDGAGLLLGADWFARHLVWISNATDRMFVRPARPAH